VHLDVRADRSAFWVDESGPCEAPVYVRPPPDEPEWPAELPPPVAPPGGLRQPPRFMESPAELPPPVVPPASMPSAPARFRHTPSTPAGLTPFPGDLDQPSGRRRASHDEDSVLEPSFR
jgi:hypothetical protein